MEEQAAAARVARADQLRGGGSSGSAAGGDPAMAAALAELERFHGSEELTLAFAPAALTSDQRNLVRMKAVALGYKGKSKGGGQARHLVINKPGAVKKDERTWQQRRRGGEAQSELQPESELGPSLVSGDNEDPNSSVVFLRKIPRSVGRLELMALGAQFGKVADTVLLHGRGQCVLQFESTAEATAFLSHYAEQPLVMNGKKLLCQRGAADISRTPVVMHRHILREVHHVLDDIVRKLVTAEAAENRRNRHKRQKRHRKLLKEQRLASRGLLHDSEVAALNGGGGGAGGGESAGAGADQIRHDICWDFVKSGGKCYRGDSCQYTHEMVPLHQIPVKLRFLMSEDTFPESREINPEKAAVNQTLAELSADVPNRRCLVLDGATCSSVRVLRGMGAEDSESAAGSRQASDVVVPNVVTTTFLEIQKLQICEAFHGSLRVYMDSHPAERFGAIYLDYCCRLGAGKFAVEMSPTADLETLFRHGLCDPSGCVLAITLAKEDREAAAGAAGGGGGAKRRQASEAAAVVDAPQKLRYLVTRHAASRGLVAVVWGRRFSYGGMFVEMFWVCEPAAVQHMPSFDDG